MAEYDYVKTIPVAEPTDVLVVGSGPSGLGAAIASGRAGASTRLVERFGFLGGDLTAGMVHPCMTSFSLDGSTQLVRGIFDEFIRRLEAKGAAVHPSLTKSGTPYSGFMKYGHEAVTPFDHEAAKLESMDMCDEAGVDVLLHSFAIDTVVDQGKVKGVIVGNKSGLMLLPAEVVVDCTGRRGRCSQWGRKI
jgi:flavin-dependent dehydrogenase